ncbi:hypothetical protein Q8F55_001384 [Vanrija albida]|uniref:AB hydrolase-1 domain-containing protein n=1 Tax=Vanrija albida TaxID=181172 RepID=A0ABR3QFX8_9TREE
MASFDGESSVGSNFDPRLDFLQAAGDGQLPVRCFFEHRKAGCEGLAAMTYWPPKRGNHVPPENFILFILGNPGLLNYYQEFLEELHAKIPDSYAILCTSHVGHDPSCPPPSKPFDLIQTLETKIELVETIQSSLNAWHVEGGLKGQGVPAPRFTLMGHSVGAWMCSQMLERRMEGIHVTYLLFPTLGWISRTWNAKKMWPVFRAPLRQMGPGVGVMLRPFFRMGNANKTTISMIHDRKVIKNVLHLARSEMDNIRAPNLTWWKEESYQPTGRGIYTVWSGGKLDQWVGKEANQIRESLGPERSWRLEGVKHAFCLYPGAAPIVANVVQRLLANDVTHPDAAPHGPMITDPNEITRSHTRAREEANGAAEIDPVMEKQAQREQYYAAQQQIDGEAEYQDATYEPEAEANGDYQDATYQPAATYADKHHPVYIQTNVVGDEHHEKKLQHERLQAEELSRPAYNQTDSQPDVNIQRPYAVV